MAITLTPALLAAVNAYDEARRKAHGRVGEPPMSDANKRNIAPMILAAIQAYNQPQPNWVGEFRTFNAWVDNASCVLPGRPDSNGYTGPVTQVGIPAVCIDAKGRRCTNGRDFMRARDEDAFPVRYFWDCEPPT